MDQGHAGEPAATVVAERCRVAERMAGFASLGSQYFTSNDLAGTTLTDLHGIADVVAAKILARFGAITRFRSQSAFASYCGVAPIEVSSGDVQRHRLSRAGDRQLNYALHVMAMAQIKRETPRPRLLPAGNEPPVRPIKKPCAVSNGAWPTSSTAP